MARSNKPLDSQLRARVWKLYSETSPKPGQEYDRWVEETAQRLECGESQVRRVVADECGSMLLAMRSHNASVAQQVSQFIGATMTEALQVCVDLMRASDKRVIKDRDGKPVLDENGEPKVHETPNWEARKSGAALVFKVQGAFAPTEVEVKSTVLHADLSSAELLEKLEQLNASIREFSRDLAPSGTGSGANKTRVNGKKSRPGSLLLADPMHKDEGRAEPGSPG